MASGSTSGIVRALGRIRSRRKIDEAELAAMVKDLRRALQEADFNVRQTKEMLGTPPIPTQG